MCLSSLSSFVQLERERRGERQFESFIEAISETPAMSKKIEQISETPAMSKKIEQISETLAMSKRIEQIKPQYTNAFY